MQNKITLKEYINNPFNAIKRGYYPDFMSVGALVASFISLETGRELLNDFNAILNGSILESPKGTVIFILKSLICSSLILLFPAWWFVFYLMHQSKYKKARKNEQA